MTGKLQFRTLLVTALIAGIIAAAPARAQDDAKQTIPFHIEEGAAAAEQSAQLRMALGIAIDPFPVLLSAASGEFGISIQPWFGIDHFKIRIDITHQRVPDPIAGSRYFYKNSVNAFSLAVGYMFGKNFDGFYAGLGFGMWQNTISHKFLNRKGTSINPFIEIEGGYVWMFHNNLYIEPLIALDIMLTEKKMNIYGFTYKPIPVAGEITLKFGMFVDL